MVGITRSAAKQENGYREISLAPVAVNTLREWLACPPPKPGGRDLVFPNPGGGVITREGLQWGFAEAQIAAGVVDARNAEYALHAPAPLLRQLGDRAGL